MSGRRETVAVVVVTYNRADLLGRTHIGLDFFDATISRTAAWVVGTRNMQKALLRALLLP